MVHHSFKKGQKVLVILRNGDRIIDRYYGQTSNYLKLDNNNIEWKNIRSSTIYKNKGTDK